MLRIPDSTLHMRHFLPHGGEAAGTHGLEFRATDLDAVRSPADQRQTRQVTAKSPIGTHCHMGKSTAVRSPADHIVKPVR